MIYYTKYCLKSTKIITNTAEVIQEWLHRIAAVDNRGLMCLPVQSLCAAVTSRNVPQELIIISIKMYVFMNFL